MSTEKKILIILAAILACAAALRFYGLDWGAPPMDPNPDERHVMMTTGRMLDERDLNPKTFCYGSLQFYILYGACRMLSILFKGGRGVPFETIIMTGRYIAAFFGLLTILATYFLGRRLYSVRTGLLAALFLTLSVLHIQLSHFYTVDVVMAFFCVCAILCASRLIKPDSRALRWFILLGVSIGMAIATKFSGVPLFLIPVAVLIWGMRDRLDRRRIWRSFAICIIVALAVWFVCEPYAFVGKRAAAPAGAHLKDRMMYTIFTKQFAHDILEQGRMVKGYKFCSLPWTIQYENTTPYAYQTKELLDWWMGWPLGLTCLIGTFLIVARNVRRIERRDIIILLWIVPVFLIIGSFQVKFPRYMVPLFPFLCIFGGNLFDRLLIWSSRSRWSRVSSRAAVALLVLVAGYSLFYSIAFVRMYGAPHNWIRASAWIYENIPPGSVIIREGHWDDDLPVSVPGYRPIRYKKIILGLYGQPDNRAKLARFTSKLSEGDFIVMTTRRIYGTTLQDPDRFPITGSFYRLLFSQKLGYELVKTFTSPPGLLGFTFDDDCADESFRVYDHPKVAIFKKVAALSPEQMRVLIQSPPPEVAAISRAEIMEAKEGGVEAARDWEEGKLPRLTGPVGWELWQVLKWLFVVEILSLIVLPLTVLVFREFMDKGYILSKTLAILIVSYVSWLLASLGWVDFSSWSSFLAVLLLVALSLMAFSRERRLILAFLKRARRIIIIEEITFLVIFIVYLLVRAYNPEIFWGEKPMDFSFLNIIMRTDHFPPVEPWFSGTPMNYYYFGYCVNTVLAQLSGVPTSIAFNLGNALIPALVAGGVFSIVYEMTKRVRWAMLGVFFSSILGNLDAVRMYVVSPSSPLYKSGIWDRFWATSRVLPHPSIAEYPNWSFLFADLHGHVMVMPFAVLGFCIAYCLLKSRDGIVPRVLLAGLILGGLLFTNIWNYPVGAAVIAVALIMRGATMHRQARGILGRAVTFVREGAIPLIAIIILSVVFFLPYFRSLEAGSAIGYGMISMEETAGVHHVLIHFGIFIFIFFSFSLLHLAVGRRRRRVLASSFIGVIAVAFIMLWPWLGPRVGKEGSEFAAYGAAWVYIITFALVSLCFLVKGQSRERIFGLTLVLMGLTLCIMVEFFFLIDHMNTAFKLYVQAWFFFSIGGAYCVYLTSRLPLARPLRAAWTICLVVLLAAGVFCSATNMIAVAAKSRARFPLLRRPSLDGLGYKRLKSPDEYEAIMWMNENIAGTPIILEAWGPSYQDYTRISMNTGLPTVLGWEHHVFQRGKPRSEIGKRKSDIRRIYRSINKRAVMPLIQKYAIRYIVVGDVEKRTYGDKGLAGFEKEEDLFEKVYSKGSFFLYRVKDVELEVEAPAHVVEAPSVTITMFEGGEGDLPGQFHQPRGIAVDDKYAYVCDTMNNRIQKFALKRSRGEKGGEAGRFVAQWGEVVLNQPCGIAVRGNLIYVADTWNQRIVLFSKDGKELATFGEGCYGPRGIAVDSRGNIYLSDSGNGVIKKFNGAGKELALWGKETGPGELKRPLGTAIDRRDRVYVADKGSRCVKIFDRDGKYLSGFKVDGWKDGVFNEPYIDVDGHGNIYITDPLGHCALKYSGSGKLLGTLKPMKGGKHLLNFPMGIAVAKKGNTIFIADCHNHRIKEFSSRDFK